MQFVATTSVPPSVITGNSTGGHESSSPIASGEASVGTAMSSTPVTHSTS